MSAVACGKAPVVEPDSAGEVDTTSVEAAADIDAAAETSAETVAQDATAAVDAQGDATVADAVPDSEADTVAVPDAPPTDIAPPLCWDAPPPPDAMVADVAPADTAGCNLPSPMSKWTQADGKPLGPKTWTVEIGVANPATGSFTPYDPGQWVSLSFGIQCGFHVWAAVRVTGPGFKPGKVAVDVKGRAYLGCGQVASSLEDQYLLYPDPDKPGAATSANLGGAVGLRLAFVDKDTAAYCSKWLTLAVEVRDKASGAWGRGETVVRLYGAENKNPCK